MPYSFVQIEQEKSRTIQWSVGFLFLLYFLAATVMVLLIKAYMGGYFGSERYLAPVSLWSFMDWSTLGWTFGGSSMAGLAHFAFSTDAIIDRTLQMMGGRLADPAKDQEKIFSNVVEEASVATGGKYRIEPWIIPATAMNAFALQDFQGRSVIGITEGLLLRLNREQLESVVAHEAGHIASGDCKETTVTSVLFKVFDNVCDVSFNVLRFSGSGRSRKGGGAVPIILIILLVAWVFKFVSVVGAFFISREREYRADALAVRLTRNPKALAEALYIISQRWKGAGLPGQAMDAIFIENPRFNALEEGEENLFTNLFSTHPPVQRRISILLDMAHSKPEELDAALKQAQIRSERALAPQPVADASGQGPQWMAMHDGQWLGPFDQAGIMALSWLRRDTPVKRLGEPVVLQAGVAPYLAPLLKTAGVQKNICPRCNVALVDESYEGVALKRCVSCEGVLVTEVDTLSIIGKREKVFDARIEQLARVAWAQIRPLPHGLGGQIYNERSIVCPQCLDGKNPMTRRLVSQKFPVEVDKCKGCGRVWFDKDELEILQAMYEMDKDGRRI